MHRVLQISEVLLNIFCHLVPSGPGKAAYEEINLDLAALARTCRAFKEPALDVLWSELDDPSPLLRCLAIASPKKRRPIARKSAPPLSVRHINKRYTSTRPLERAEWDILHSYARRIWSLHDFKGGLDWEFITKTYIDLTPAELLFPNLRSLHCKLTKESVPLFQLPFPSLINIHFNLDDDPSIVNYPLQSLAKTSPNVKRLEVFCEDWIPEDSEDGSEFKKMILDCIHGWSNLQSMTCPRILLDMSALVHLSRMPSLVQLTFGLSDTLPDSSSPSESLSFPTLNKIKLHGASLVPISRFLSRIRFHAVTHFTVTINECPSKQDLVPFMAGIQMVGMGQTIQEFDLDQVPDSPNDIGVRNPDAPLLDLDDLRSCMAFTRLSHMSVDLEWGVSLVDDELLKLGQAWPQLEELFINANWGWNRPGITPNGLAVLLETRPSLSSIALAIDTQGCTDMPARRCREPVSQSSFKRPFQLNVVDSIVEKGSVDAMAAFFASVVPHLDFILTSWGTWPVLDDEDVDDHRERWRNVQSRAREVIKRQWLNLFG